jgi:hypothetical protein
MRALLMSNKLDFLMPGCLIGAALIEIAVVIFL